VRVTRKQAEANREKVLDVAGTLFRERGFEGIGVADIMKRAGLTHGGFYGQFASKDDLVAETTERVLKNPRWQERLTGKTNPSFAEVVRATCLRVIATIRNGLFDRRAWGGRRASAPVSSSRPHRWVARPA